MLSLVNNMASLTAENNLSNANNALNTSLQRLSSGLQINSGADNPAGLVISQEQQAQMSGLQAAITNTSVATNVVQTADGALNETNSLLLQIRGLAVSAANTGANDPNTLAADQAQIANALQTISSIANSTQYGQTLLLNGSHAVTASVQGTAGAASATVQASGTTETGNLSASATTGTAAGTYTATITSLAQQATATGTPVSVTQAHVATTTGGTETGTVTASATNNTPTGTYTFTVNSLATQATADSSSTLTGLAIAAGTEENLSINGVNIDLNGGTGGLSGQDVVNAINNVASQTGVSATLNPSSSDYQIALTANAYGSTGNGYSVTETDVTPATGTPQLGFSATSGAVTLFANGADATGTLVDSGSNSISVSGYGNVLTGANGLSITTDPVNGNANGTVDVNVAAGTGLAIAANASETLTIDGVNNTPIVLNGGANGLTVSGVVQAINQYTSQTGVTATVNSSNELVFTANAYGSAGNGYSITENSGTALGFSSTATNFQSGADVAGSIAGPGSPTASGSGNVLTGSNGLAITTDPLGTAGTISVAVQAGSSANISAASTVNTASGTYTANITRLATQATLEGNTDLSATGAQVVGANEADLLTINGVQIQLNGGASGLDANGAAAAINQYSNQTGVKAGVSTSGGTFLQLTSTGYGSTQNITVEESGVTNPGSGGSVTGLGTGLASGAHTAGLDVEGTVTGNGNTYATTGTGNVLTAANDLSITTDPNGQTGNLTTVVTNNAMLFQIGADAGQTATVSMQNMQANAIGTGVTNSSGITNLSQIDVTNSNQSSADILKVIDQAISQVSSLAGNLGSFQDNTLQATSANLQSSLQNTTAANSTIRDTDFATESANYAQNQVLVQAGTQVLKNANQLPQLVLTLLQ